MNLSVMTFHESYGDIPRAMLSLYRLRNVSQSDHDLMLAAFGWEWNSPEIDWSRIYDLVIAHSASGILRLPMYL